MGRRLEEVIAALPEERRARVEARFRQLKDEVTSLGELRRAAGKAQAEIAATLKIRQPSVSKIEKQADMYLSTLRSYVEAIGGEFDLIVRLPSREPLRIEGLGDVTAGTKTGVGRGRKTAGQRARAKGARVR